ncbi:LysR substrate-binding domain-containing protein [Pontibacterium granulatum]|uniref:LysR substrate-binding domain-containing protein n=1 Tax=Pontibacterium granulatum TaxID=2036029 RepID=UPI00249BBDFD|nr:LysR substrate-binding domain-containing protein [Pontibacterium granulatum]MDI3326293.1 LysR substrate-binding domain-containing protein [Pontibacterium granulatum]
MEQKPIFLPPLNALRTFEAAARLCSFKDAADELCVTQAAVSRQIRYLEESLKTDLFLRSHRRVELTEAGRKLYATVHRSLIDIAETSREIHHSSGPAHLNLHVTSSFAQLWLVPRLNALRSLYPGIHLNLVSVDENPLVADKFDAAITLGLEEDAGYQSEFLFAEEIFPVCTPAFRDAHPEVNTLQGLIQHPLLDLDPQFWRARWWSPVDWNFWLRQCGVDASPVKAEMTFSHFPMLLDAVLQDVGVGLGWRHLVQDRLDDGRLIRPVRDSYPAPARGHYFVCRNDLAQLPAMQMLRSWVLEQTAVLRNEHS